MYQVLALITGIVLAIMVSINGNLSEQHGAFPAAAIIHIVGSLFALVLCALQKEKKALWSHGPKWIYLGGAIGVFTTVFQNLAFGHISMTSIVALALLGQTVTSLIIDGLGLFGMAKRLLQKSAWIGLLISVIGILLMLDDTVTSAVVAVCVSFGSGISMVLSRTVNARLAEKTGALRGSLVNHLVGLPITVFIALALTKDISLVALSAENVHPWIYTGGLLGVAVILLFNITVPEVPALKLTLLTFVGQVFAGILLDLIVGKGYSDASFTGGIIIAIGITVNLITEQVSITQERKR